MCNIDAPDLQQPKPETSSMEVDNVKKPLKDKTNTTTKRGRGRPKGSGNKSKDPVVRVEKKKKQRHNVLRRRKVK